MTSNPNVTVAAILDAHRTGAATPAETVAASYARIRAHGDPAVFITLRDEADAIAEAKAIAATDGRVPLYGVPFAVKDNIDVKGLPTTAACPAFAYEPSQDATCVARLRRAGAIVIGKTNLDQFATGLIGTRTPYGIPRNTLKAGLIPGGSSSGSAVAVAAGLVPLALGTDTAGSGRIPAALNNIVGLKPSLGLVSTFGLVPACRTLDCVSVFALTVDDGFAALAAMAGADHADPYSRARPLGALGPMPEGIRLGVPTPGDRLFFGDKASAAAYEAALARLARLGAKIIEIDIEPFYETARLLYEGPWVAERYITARSLIASAPESMHPVTRQIILGGARPSAVDTFAALYKLEELRRVRDHAFRAIDALVLPTMPTAYTVEQVLADPIGLNSRLGTYTNFVNLLELCAAAVPSSIRDDGVPFGVTLLALGRPRRAAGVDRARVSRRYRAAARRHRAGAAAARQARVCGRGRRHPAGGGRRASLRHGAQWRIDRARRDVPGDDQDAARLPAVCARLDASAEARAPAGRGRQGRGDRGRDLDAAARGLRPLRRRGAGAAVDRHLGAGRRPDGEGLSGRGRGGHRRARHLGIRRLARVPGAGRRAGVMPLTNTPHTPRIPRAPS